MILRKLIYAGLVTIISPLFFPSNARPQESLRLPIKVHNTTGAPATNFPVAAGVPLPKGKYFDKSRFGLLDASGSPVPCQIEVLNRNWATDRSLRHILVQFLADVPPNGESVYYLTDMTGSVNSTPLEVLEQSDKILINTGVVRVTVKKERFNLFDEVFIDADRDGQYEPEERLIQPDTLNGGILTHLNGKLQKSSDAPFADRPFEVVVEESGPIRAVIRVETYTYSRSYDEQYHGFQARIYFYAGTGIVRVRYTLKNSDFTTRYRRPLYFDDFSLFSKLAFSPKSIFFGYDGQTIELPANKGYYLYQKRHNKFELRNSNNQQILSGNKGNGWIDLNGNGLGIFAMIRDFWQTWPNAVEYTPNNSVRIGLWPRFGQDWWWNAWNDGKTVSTAGLYWLDDMQEATKEAWYVFHDQNFNVTEMINTASLLQWPVTASVPLSWYAKTKVTFDMGGYVPLENELDAAGTFHEFLLGEYGTERSENWNTGNYMYGWFNYAGNINRRGSCGGGGWPYSAARFILTGNPYFYYLMRAKSMGELNGRPMWLSGYKYERDQPNARLFFGYCWESWREEKEDEPYLPGTDRHWWWPRDLAHFWVYDLEEYYYFSGDNRIRDWYEFIGEALAVPLIEQYASGEYTDRATRSLGHSLAAMVQAFRVTGNPKFLEYAKTAVAAFHKRQNPYNGTFQVTPENPDSDGEAPFQMGYMARALINFLEEVGDSDPKAYLEAWGILQGIMEWNLNLAKYTYYWKPGETNEVSGTGVTLADPEAWFYLHTGDVAYRDQLLWYIDNGAYGDLSNWGWEGSDPKTPQDLFVGRLTHYMLKYNKKDSIPPSRVNDLRGNFVGQYLRLTWTAPQETTRFHIRWSIRPIAKRFTTNPDSCNFWAAHGIGKIPDAAPGEKMELAIDAREFPQGVPIYLSLVSFDTENNMSEVSNLVRIENILSSDSREKNIPEQFQLLGNVPNPFSEATRLRFINDQTGNITIRIFDLRGQLVQEIRKSFSEGYQEIKWDGKSLRGTRLPSGVYYVQVYRSSKVVAKSKILILY